MSRGRTVGAFAGFGAPLLVGHGGLAVVPDQPGLEFTARGTPAHFTARGEPAHFTARGTPVHYTARED